MADVSTYKVYGTLPTIPEEQVQKLIEQSEGGTLPEVTTTDNGKVLTVVEGEWDKAEAGGGGGLLISVTNTYESATMNKTFSEIKTALESGNQVVCLWPDDEYTTHQRYIVTGCKCDIGSESNTYTVYIMYGSSAQEFLTDDVDGYPAFDW